MRDMEIKKGKLMRLKDELDDLDSLDLDKFLFEFIKEPSAYVTGRFSEAINLEDIKKAAEAFLKGKVQKKILLNEIDKLLSTIAELDDPYDREVLYSIASAYLALIDREHAFDAILHDLDSIVLDVGFDSSLTVIPLRIDHHSETINKVKGKNDKLVYNEKAKIYANVSILV